MGASLPIIVDSRGAPLRADTAFNAAERAGNELASWQPGLLSADGEWLGERETALARVHDLIRNHGGISGAVQTQVDNMVGAGLRLAAKPNWIALGIDDPALQLKLEAAIETAFDDWGNDPGYYCDVERNLTFGGLVARGCRTHLSTFEILAVAEWLTDRPGAKFATALRGVDPLRLSQPQSVMESATFKSGIEFDRYGAARAYHIANRVPTDRPTYSRRDELLRWVRVPRETSWGRANVIHIFDHEKDGQTRGRGGILSALTRAKMLDKHEQAHLQQSILSAVYSMFVTSPFGWESIGQALGAGQGIDDQLASYLQNKTDFHKEANVRFNGVKIPHLFPGEKIEKAQAATTANFESFERIFHRYIASGLNMTYEQFTRDYSQTNYSGHRAALLDYWRFVTGRRSSISGKYAGAIYVLWLEEFLDSGGLDELLPKTSPSFWDAKAAWTRHEWIGPGQGQIDPLKEANATMVEFRCGVTTLEAECAARGRDWRAVMIQRAQEAAEATRLETEYKLPPGALAYAQGTSPAPPAPDPEPEKPSAPAKPAEAKPTESAYA